MESNPPKPYKTNLSGAEFSLKIQYWTIRLVELTTISLMISSSLYSLISNRIYNLIVAVILRVVPLQAPAQVLPLIPPLMVSASSLYFFALGRQKHMERIHVLTWLIHLPSILWYSQIDWFQAVGFPVNFQIFQTRLTFMETLLASVVLVAGRIMLFYTSQLRETYSELLKRGAAKEDVENALSKATAFMLAFLVISSLSAIAAIYAIFIIKPILSPLLAGIPYRHIIIGIICLMIIPICIIAFIYNQAKAVPLGKY
jgi:hypothetical protein